MKNFIVFVVVSIFLSFTAVAQQNRPPLEDIVNAIKSNRTEELSKYFDNIVPVTINNNQTIYSRNQAEVVLKDFFERNLPKDFLVLDNGSPNSTTKFIIGNLITPSGLKYSVYILIKQKDSNYYFQEIRLNKE
jgi:hypothetical protein